jgi:hypothetical protein
MFKEKCWKQLRSETFVAHDITSNDCVLYSFLWFHISMIKKHLEMPYHVII